MGRIEQIQLPAVTPSLEGASSRFEGPQNNGMKLTARGASVEARQLIPVFGRQDQQ